MTYQHFHFVEILGLAVAVLDLFGEDKVELKQEHPTLPGLTNQFFGVPHLEGILNCKCQKNLFGIRTHLEDNIAEPIISEITTVEEGEVESVVGLPRHREAHVQPLLDLTHLRAFEFELVDLKLVYIYILTTNIF